MLETFIAAQREEIIARSKNRATGRTIATQQLPDGIPVFLGQLVAALRLADSTDKINHDEIRQSAGKEGEAAFKIGLNIEEVVHGYGDICQTITELAVEMDVHVPTGEFRVMNLCLDDAVAQAVTQFASHSVDSSETQRIDRLGMIANELRAHLASATKSFAFIKTGQVAPGGTTAMILDRSLTALSNLIERAITDAPPKVSS